jgi:hypothetical protein
VKDLQLAHHQADSRGGGGGACERGVGRRQVNETFSLPPNFNYKRPVPRKKLHQKWYLFICDEDIEYLSVVGLEEEGVGPRPLVQVVVLARPAHHQLVRRHQFSARASLHRPHVVSTRKTSVTDPLRFDTDPRYHWITDPDPAPFFDGFQDVNKK